MYNWQRFLYGEKHSVQYELLNLYEKVLHHGIEIHAEVIQSDFLSTTIGGMHLYQVFIRMNAALHKKELIKTKALVSPGKVPHKRQSVRVLVLPGNHDLVVIM